MSDLDLGAIEARANAATPGPWEWTGYPGNETKELKATHHKESEYVLRGSADCGGGEWFTDVAVRDAEFIAHAREDVPALIAEIRRLHTLIDRNERLLQTRVKNCQEHLVAIQRCICGDANGEKK